MVDAGKTPSMFSLWWLAVRRGDQDEAETWYRKASDADDPYMAVSFANKNIQLAEHFKGHTFRDEAARWYRKAVEGFERVKERADRGEPTTVDPEASDMSYANVIDALVRLAEERGDQDEAISWYRRAIDSGGLWARVHRKMAIDGGSATAIRALAWAADSGNDRAIWELGQVFEERGHSEEAVACYREAADRGNTWAMVALGRLAKERGDQDEVITWSRKAIDSGASSWELGLGGLEAWGLEARRPARHWWHRAWRNYRR